MNLGICTTASRARVENELRRAERENDTLRYEMRQLRRRLETVFPLAEAVEKGLETLFGPLSTVSVWDDGRNRKMTSEDTLATLAVDIVTGEVVVEDPQNVVWSSLTFTITPGGEVSEMDQHAIFDFRKEVVAARSVQAVPVNGPVNLLGAPPVQE